MKIMISWPIRPLAYELLNEHLGKHELIYPGSFDDDNLINLVKSTDVLIAGKAKASILVAGKRLSLVQSYISGVGHIDIQQAAQLRLPVASAKGFNATSVAEHILMFFLYLIRSPFTRDQEIRQKIWIRDIDLEELSGKTLAIIGLGKVGSELAKRAKAFDMKVMAIRRRPDLGDNYSKVDFLGGPDSIDFILRQADFVSINLPAVADTVGLFDKTRIQIIKPGAILVNTSRGQILDQAGLYDALCNGHLRAAGLDVFSPEPPDASHPLFGLNNIIFSPHIAGRSRESEFRRAQFIAQNIDALEQGKQIINLVDPELGY